MKNNLVIVALTLVAKQHSNFLKEGKHDVTIKEVAMEKFSYNDTPALAITFENADKQSHKQLMPITGYRTWDEEGPEAKFPDALTAEEKQSGEFAPDVDEDGNIVSNYAMRVAKKNAKGVLVNLERPAREVSEGKSAAAQDIIARLANAAGIAPGTEFDVNDLKGLELNINLGRQNNPQDGKSYMRVVSFAPAVGEEV